MLFKCYEEFSDSDSENDSEVVIEDRLTDLSRNLLAEVAFQSLPPSGIPVSIPRMMMIKERNRDLKNEGYLSSITSLASDKLIYGRNLFTRNYSVQLSSCAMMILSITNTNRPSRT